MLVDAHVAAFPEKCVPMFRGQDVLRERSRFHRGVILSQIRDEVAVVFSPGLLTYGQFIYERAH